MCLKLMIYILIIECVFKYKKQYVKFHTLLISDIKTYVVQGDIFLPKTTIQPILHPDRKMPAIGKIDFSIEKRASIALEKCPPFLTCER